MKYLTTYKIFESSQDYGIYDWIEDLKRHDWSYSQNQTVNESSLKKWSDIFIGEGWYDKVNSLVDKMFQSIDKVDVNYINDRMFDIYDIIPSGKDAADIGFTEINKIIKNKTETNYEDIILQKLNQL